MKGKATGTIGTGEGGWSGGSYVTKYNQTVSCKPLNSIKPKLRKTWNRIKIKKLQTFHP